MLKQLLKHSRLAYRRSPYFKERLVEDVLKGILLFWIVASLWSYLGVSVVLLQEQYGATTKQAGLLFLLALPFIDLLIRFFFQRVPNLSVIPYLALQIPRKIIVRSVFFRSFASPWFLIILLGYLGLFAAFLFFGYSMIQNISIVLYLLGSLLLVQVTNFWIKLGDNNRQQGFFGVYVIIALFVLAHRFKLIDFIPALLSFSTSFFNVFLPSVLPLLLFGVVTVLIFKQIPAQLTEFKDDTVTTKSLPIQLFSRFGDVGRQVDYEIMMAVRLKAVRSVLLFTVFWVLYPLIIGMAMTDEDGIRNFLGLLMGMFTSYGIVQYGNYAFSWHTFHFDAIQANSSIKTVLWGKYYFMMLIGFIAAIIATIVYAILSPWFLPYIWIGFYFNISLSLFLALYYSIRFTKPKNPYKSSVLSTSNTEFNMETIILSLLYFGLLILPYAVGSIIWGPEIGMLFVLGFSLILFLLRARMMSYIVTLYRKNRYTMHQKFHNYSE